MRFLNYVSIIVLFLALLLISCGNDAGDIVIAIESRNFDDAAQLIKNGTPVNDESLPVQPLEQAVRSSSLEIFELLLEYGADPEYRFASDQSPIEFLLSRKYFRYLEPLLEAGANFDVTWNDDPLAFYLIEMRQVTLVMKMIEFGYNPTVTDSFSSNLLLQEISMIDVNPDFIQFLIHAGADPFEENDARISALSAALMRGKNSAVYAIIDSDIDIQQANSLWSPMIHSWTESSMEEIAVTFLSLGIPIDRPNEFPLHFAVRQASFQAFHWLLEHGADPNRRDNNGVLPEYYTRYYPRFGDTAEASLWMERYEYVNDEIQKYR
jgi:ankyrin repeat protein